jgi:regulatory protein
MPELSPFDRLTQKMKHYCAYQERCHQEVLQKAQALGATKHQADEISVILIQEGFLNEERFAQSFVRGKHRIKRWGRLRLTAELKARQISPRNIDTALKEIDPDEYEKAFHELAQKCWEELAGQPILTRKKKCHDYLMRKGYEAELIRSFLEDSKI